eukprot:IDg6781t1
MGRGRSLTKEEIAVVLALSQQNLSLQARANEINRSKTAVGNVLVCEAGGGRTVSAVFQK